eukprot:scaffold231265_cov19-Tisochrysis_lutea.AAC.1
MSSHERASIHSPRAHRPVLAAQRVAAADVPPAASAVQEIGPPSSLVPLVSRARVRACVLREGERFLPRTSHPYSGGEWRVEGGEGGGTPDSPALT